MIVETHLCLNEVADADLGHDRDGHGLNDLLDHFRVTLSWDEYPTRFGKRIATHHPSDTTGGTDVCGNAFKCHHSTGLERNPHVSFEWH